MKGAALLLERSLDTAELLLSTPDTSCVLWELSLRRFRPPRSQTPFQAQVAGTMGVNISSARFNIHYVFLQSPKTVTFLAG